VAIEDKQTLLCRRRVHAIRKSAAGDRHVLEGDRDALALVSK
jgi:hypothetical protein